jgi:hypothetical protein
MTYLRYRLVVPVILCLAIEFGEKIRSIDYEIVEPIASGLYDRDCNMGVLGQTGCNNKACCAAAANDIVELFLGQVLDRHVEDTENRMAEQVLSETCN